MDIRRERQQAMRHIRRAENMREAVVKWFVLDPSRSTTHAVYDEVTRAFEREVDIPVLFNNELEGDNLRTPEGRTLLRSISFGVALDTLTERGIPDAEDAKARLNDIVVWDGMAFRIDSYEPGGQWPTTALTIQVDAVRQLDWDYPRDNVDLTSPGP